MKCKIRVVDTVDGENKNNVVFYNLFTFKL